MKVYLVGICDAEENGVRSLHRTYAGAKKAWNALRLALLEDAENGRERWKGRSSEEMYTRMVKNLSCTDPNKLENYPHDTPYIHERELEE